MRFIATEHFLQVFLTLLITLIPLQAFGAMTVFNDDGNWQLGILGDPDDGNAVYRACKNSSDRIGGIEVPESLAILCITFSQASGTISAGLWMDEAMDENARSGRCLLAPDNEKPVSVFCKVMPSKIGKLQIELTDDVALVQKLLKAEKLKIIFKNKFLRNGKLDKLEFEPDASNFAAVAPVIFKRLHHLR